MEDYVSFEQAKVLKELGFNYKSTYGYYKIYNESANFADIRRCEVESWEHDSVEFYKAPTLSLAQKWLREVKDIHIEIKYTPSPNMNLGWEKL